MVNYAFCVQKPKSCAISEKWCATVRSHLLETLGPATGPQRADPRVAVAGVPVVDVCPNVGLLVDPEVTGVEATSSWLADVLAEYVVEVGQAVGQVEESNLGGEQLALLLHHRLVARNTGGEKLQSLW